MLKIGITGALAMGKSTVARMFGRHMPVFEADAAVNTVYAPGGLGGVALAFLSGVVREDGSVDKKVLWEQIQGDKKALARLEKLIHPLVGVLREEFFEKHKEEDLVALEIPLLYETGADVDVVVVVSAPPTVQRQRALKRPLMTQEKFEMLTRRQLSDTERRARADFVIDTNTSLEKTQKQVDALVKKLKERTNA